MKIISDISKKTINFVEEDKDQQYFVEFYFCFVDNGNLPVIFDNLSFGMLIKDSDGQTLHSFIEPKENFEYNRTDQDYLFSYEVRNFSANVEYTINVWCKNNDNEWEKEFPLIFPENLN